MANLKAGAIITQITDLMHRNQAGETDIDQIMIYF